MSAAGTGGRDNTFDWACDNCHGGSAEAKMDA